MLSTFRLAGLAGILATVSACSKGEPTAPPGPPSAMSVVSGNNQSAPAGTTVPLHISFKVTDKSGRGVPNTAVAFQVAGGEGFLANLAVVQTDPSGVVIAPSWTLGKINIPQQIVATTGNLSAIATATVSSLYQAEVRFFGPTPDPNFAAAFTRAVNKVNAEIVGPSSPQQVMNLDVAKECGATGVAPLNETITAMVVFVTITRIDGVGRILASSGPCGVRSSSQLTVVGVMTFDSADVRNLYNSGQLNDVALHEMQHVVGFGTLWTKTEGGPLDLLMGKGTPQTAFIGSLGTAACRQLGGSQAVCLPGVLLENTGGGGTADGHWRRTIFTPELMVGFIAPAGTAMPLSAMTIAAQGDLGYTVNMSMADAYTVTSSVASLLETVRAAQGLAVEDYRDELLLPRFQVTGNGKVTKLR